LATKPLTIDNITYNYPGAGEDPGWGEDATGWAEGVTNVVNTLQGPGDILETTFNIANNQISPVNVNGLAFDTGVVRSAKITYSIYRISTANPSGNTESGTIDIVYDDSATSGNKWLIIQEAAGDSGVLFDITDSGQFTYTSTDINSTGYSGIMKFKASTLGQ